MAKKTLNFEELYVNTSVENQICSLSACPVNTLSATYGAIHVFARDAALAYMLKNHNLQVYVYISMNVVIHFVIVVFVIINYN